MAQLQREQSAGQQAHQNAPRVIPATPEWAILARKINASALMARRRQEQIAPQLAISNARHAALALKMLVTPACNVIQTRAERVRGGLATLGVLMLSATPTLTSAYALLALATSKESAGPLPIVPRSQTPFASLVIALME